MLNKHIAAIATVVALWAGSAEAVYIVDTGPGTGSTQLTLDNQGVSYQYLGATFNVGQDSSLNSVEGWITGVGSLLFELHQGASPTGALLFSSLVTINDALGSNWYGATGLGWGVLAGDYTLTVIAQPGFTGGMQTGAANPLGTTWFANSLSPNWATTGFNVGWRIDATAATVPEPGTLGLLGLGLAGLGFARRRKTA